MLAEKLNFQVFWNAAQMQKGGDGNCEPVKLIWKMKEMNDETRKSQRGEMYKDGEVTANHRHTKKNVWFSGCWIYSTICMSI